MQLIPLQAVAAQTLAVTLNTLPTGGVSQNCRINVYEKFYGLFLDLGLNNVLIAGGVLCEDANFLIRDPATGFIGDLLFLDTQGLTDPVYTGLGERYLLYYFDQYDLSVNANLITTPTGGIGGGIPSSNANVSPTITTRGGLTITVDKGDVVPQISNTGSAVSVATGPGATTQFDPTTLLVLPWSASISGAFNGYQNGALTTPLSFVAPNQKYWMSNVNNNTNNPDMSVLSADGTYGGWIPVTG